MRTTFSRIQQAIKQTKKKILISLVILALIVIGLILLAGEAIRPSLEKAIFYYRSDGKDSKLFYTKSNNRPEYLVAIPSEEGEPGKYKVPRHSYVSHNGSVLIYFEKIGQTPIEIDFEHKDLTVHRILYKPKYVNLKTGAIEEIDKQLDTSGLVFSPNDEKIAWVLSIKESTIQEIEFKGIKREVWISNIDGANARLLATLDEKVVSLARWENDYIYFLGVKGIGYYSLGRIDVKTGKVNYQRPKYCSEDLANCQNFEFSSSGELFIYEAGLEKEGKQIIELFVGSFDNKKSWQILTKNYISDRLWMPNEESIIYTEQITPPATALQEKIHLVDLKTNKDKEIYSGSYVSQLFPDSSGEYLYFIEKETDQKFNLVRLEMKTKKTEILESGEYNQMQIFSAN